MEKDERLKDYHTLKNESQAAEYKSLFAQNAFLPSEIAVVWLLEQLKQRISSSEDGAKTRFTDLNHSPELQTSLTEGDSFYTRLFDEGNWISERVQDMRSETPFSQAIERLYNRLWDLYNDEVRSELVVYSELEHHIEVELGRHVAKDSSLNNLAGWISIKDATHGLWKFQQSWVASIDEPKIQSLSNDLVYIAPNVPLHELASLMERRHDKVAASASYATELKRLQTESDWTYVRELTDKSDMLDLNSDQHLKQDLLLRLGMEPWLKWVDGLKWPILQDHAFLFIQRIDRLEELVALITKGQLSLKTKSEHLLLMVLQNYVELIIKISNNLFHLKEGEWNYPESEDAQDIIDAARQQYDDWMNRELKDSCNRVFDMIFGAAPVSESGYFDGVFEWINSLSKQHYNNKRYPNPSLDSLMIINEAFQQKLNNDTTNKLKIVASVPINQLNWQVFEKLVGILEHDENDEFFQRTLFDTYVSYLESDHFRWNVKFEDLCLNQACNFSYVLKKLDHPLNEWKKLISKYRCIHEGWLARNIAGYEPRTKEAFVLITGACLSYTCYKENDLVNGVSVYDHVLDIVFEQYRSDFSTNEKDYWIALQLLAHIVGTYDQTKANALAQLLADKMDTEEGFLVVTQTLTATLLKQSQNLNGLSKTKIEERINGRFWIIEERYKDGMKKQDLTYYHELRDAVLAG